MRIVLKSFLSGGPHEGSPGDIRDVEPDQAEHLIAVSAAVAAPEPQSESDQALASTEPTPTKRRKAEEIV